MKPYIAIEDGIHTHLPPEWMFKLWLCKEGETDHEMTRRIAINQRLRQAGHLLSHSLNLDLTVWTRFDGIDQVIVSHYKINRP